MSDVTLLGIHLHVNRLKKIFKFIIISTLKAVYSMILLNVRMIAFKSSFKSLLDALKRLFCWSWLVQSAIGTIMKCK